MSKLVTPFEFIKASITPIPEEKQKELWETWANDSLDDFLNECNYIGCFQECDVHTLSYLKMELYVYEVNDEGKYQNYYEKDTDKESELLDILFENKVHELDEWYQRHERGEE